MRPPGGLFAGSPVPGCPTSGELVAAPVSARAPTSREPCQASTPSSATPSMGSTSRRPPGPLAAIAITPPTSTGPSNKEKSVPDADDAVRDPPDVRIMCHDKERLVFPLGQLAEQIE